MCVIIIKPAGVEMPETNILERAAIFNPHGFGLCTKERLYKTLNEDLFLRETAKISIEEPAIMHFRYATTGSVKLANCHPFVCKGVCFAHNGVLNVNTGKDMTDSETFLRNEVMPLVNKYGYGSHKFSYHMQKRAKEEYSRFAVMYKGDILMYGNFENYQRCFYSNMRFFNHFKYAQL
ncbi:MAG: class II glutamine amidotransferase [Tannerella sp.]|jgi:predicted glutamine amidotransferase|nr:class II glutamine amidotransferase [Tannerella sp.]